MRSEHPLTQLCDSLEPWLETLPLALQRKFVFELAEGLTVAVRVGAGDMERQWLVQAANELAHRLVVWLKDSELGRSQSQDLRLGSAVSLALSRAEGYGEPDYATLALALETARDRCKNER